MVLCQDAYITDLNLSLERRSIVSHRGCRAVAVVMFHIPRRLRMLSTHLYLASMSSLDRGGAAVTKSGLLESTVSLFSLGLNRVHP